MRIALYIVAGFALAAFLAVGFVLPGVRGAAEKAAAIALIAGADAARLRVAAAAAKSGTLAGAGSGVTMAPRIDPKHGELKWIVEPAGVIRGWNRESGIEIVLLPRVEAGKVAWTCRGHPMPAMPASCTGKS